jgi:nicotinamidase-related amidase
MQSVLLVIDVQQALCTGAYAAFKVDQVIERINFLARKTRSAKVPVIFIQHESSDALLKYGTEGWRLAAGLEALPNDLYVRKPASDAFHQTELHALLQTLGATDLTICGLQSDFCVDSTTRRALALGFPVVLVADGHSTMDNEVLSAEQISKHHTSTLVNLTSFGPRVTALVASEIEFGQ